MVTFNIFWVYPLLQAFLQQKVNDYILKRELECHGFLMLIEERIIEDYLHYYMKMIGLIAYWILKKCKVFWIWGRLACKWGQKGYLIYYTFLVILTNLSVFCWRVAEYASSKYDCRRSGYVNTKHSSLVYYLELKA